MILESLAIAGVGWYVVYIITDLAISVHNATSPKVRVEVTSELPPENEFAEWDAQHENSLKERNLIIGRDGKTYPRGGCPCGHCGPSRWYCT